MRISDGSSDVCSSDRHCLRRARAAPLDVVIDLAVGVGMRQFPRREPFLEFGHVRETVADQAGFLGMRREDRTSVVLGKSVSVRVSLCGRRIIKKHISYSH